MRQIASLLICAFCTANAAPLKTKFHFDDCVKVTDGFYRDCTGFVKEVYVIGGGNMYEVSMRCKLEDTLTQTVEEKNLQLQDDKVCK